MRDGGREGKRERWGEDGGINRRRAVNRMKEQVVTEEVGMR